MQGVAEDIHLLSSYTCNTTNAECTDLLCTVEGSTLERVTMSVSQCTSPPTITLEMMVSGQIYTAPVAGNTTRTLGSTGATLFVLVWYYDYSMDLQV